MSKPDSIKIDEVEYIRKDAVAVTIPKDMTLQQFLGMKLLIRTVTFHYIGIVSGFITGTRIVFLQQASWLADSGRLMQCVKEGKFNEIEPIGDCWVNLDTAIDIIPWVHPLPKDQK